MYRGNLGGRTIEPADEEGTCTIWKWIACHLAWILLAVGGTIVLAAAMIWIATR